jgi:Na+-translocating ferredoxin:NAD+ oxidoreductase RNF subunit RnfB
LNQRFHSVRLLEEKCKGCTNCIKRCPTEAIRVREGKAVINPERCIDCGECVRTCENHAKTVVTSSLKDLETFRFRIAIPAPALYGQLGKGVQPGQVVHGLLSLGFDAVCDVSFGADVATECTRRYIRRTPSPRPLISSACPAVVRLIQVRFPGLLPHVARVESPMFAAARLSRMEVSEERGIPPEDVGVFFITPCAAKVTAVIAPLGSECSYVDGAIAISDIFGQLSEAVASGVTAKPLHAGSGLGVGWAGNGGELRALGLSNTLAVDGIHNVISLLEEVETGRLRGVDYIEALACPAGCVGGPVSVENPFVARVRVREVADGLLSEVGPDTSGEVAAILDKHGEESFEILGDIPALSGLELDRDLKTAIAMMGQLEKVLADLPGLDCGACGSPTCRALAEDIVRGNASETDCMFKLRERMREVAEELLGLTKKDLPAMGRRDGK